jgi:hypothetical protein
MDSASSSFERSCFVETAEGHLKENRKAPPSFYYIVSALLPVQKDQKAKGRVAFIYIVLE